MNRLRIGMSGLDRSTDSISLRKVNPSPERGTRIQPDFRYTFCARRLEAATASSSLQYPRSRAQSVKSRSHSDPTPRPWAAGSTGPAFYFSWNVPCSSWFNLRQACRRDRNHPSIVMWSTGNEIIERTDPGAVETAKMLAERIRERVAETGVKPGYPAAEAFKRFQF